MRKLRTLVVIISSMLLMNVQMHSQNVGIGSTSFTPDLSSMLEIKSTSSGLLIPRMTTAERNAISNPAQSLLIFNTTTKCFETYVDGAWNAIWCACGSVNITASATPSSVCQGTSTILSASGASTYTWSHSLGSGSSITVTPASTTTYTVTGTSTAGCTGVATVNVTVSLPPTVANAGADINPACGVTTATLAGNTPTVGTGMWSVVSGTATITTPSSPTSGVTGLAVPGTATLRWTISNPPCASSYDDVVITTTACFTCGSTFTVTHSASGVVPETKTVTYGTVLTNLSGSNKCWITRNLGASSQASSATDASDNAAGWYWQFNRKQGYKVGPSPAWTITSIDENSDWTAAQDPCNILLGTGWRIPTYTEWNNADVNGGWDNYTETYASVLKLHAAGYLYYSDGSLRYRGSDGHYWSSTQSSSAYGWYLHFDSSYSAMGDSYKARGFSLRCLRD